MIIVLFTFQYTISFNPDTLSSNLGPYLTRYFYMAQLPRIPAHTLPDIPRHSSTSMYSSTHLTRHTKTQLNFHVLQPTSYQTYQDTAQLPCTPAHILPDIPRHSSTSMYPSPQLTRHVETQSLLHVFSDLDPLVFAQTNLLEVDNIVAGWTITIWIKSEHVSTQTFKSHSAQKLQQFSTLYGLHCLAQPCFSITKLLVHVSETWKQDGYFNSTTLFIFATMSRSGVPRRVVWGFQTPPPRSSEDIGGVLDRMSKKNWHLHFLL